MLTEEQVMAAARRCRPWAAGSRKIYISDVARELGATTGALAGELLRIHRERRGGLLARCDLVQAADPERLSQSEVRWLNSEYHFVELD